MDEDALVLQKQHLHTVAENERPAQLVARVIYPGVLQLYHSKGGKIRGCFDSADVVHHVTSLHAPTSPSPARVRYIRTGHPQQAANSGLVELQQEHFAGVHLGSTLSCVMSWFI